MIEVGSAKTGIITIGKGNRLIFKLIRYPFKPQLASSAQICQLEKQLLPQKNIQC
jgi:hypothetical protein